MKIVTREKFLKMPEGTLYSKYEPCVFGELCIKGESWEVDFLYQDIVSSVECSGSDEFFGILDTAEETGCSFDMDLDCQGRDGLYDMEQLFAVWETKDVVQLISRLQATTLS
jgi:hypothetical protein